ncbi:MAG: pyridoxal phosphate biosynthetic protein [Erythrobacter sp.]|nr:pyridoxal phosphate biosynthetic protein [Erythrobacter sp.]
MARSLTGRQGTWALAGAVPFLASIAFLGIAFGTGALIAFAVAWPLFQVFGYAGSLRLARGEIDHPLVKTQVVLHWMMLVLLIAITGRAL